MPPSGWEASWVLGTSHQDSPGGPCVLVRWGSQESPGGASEEVTFSLTGGHDGSPVLRKIPEAGSLTPAAAACDWEVEAEAT